MGILKTAPPPVRSAEELMAMAHAMEEEAARRYRELAVRMRLRGEDNLAGLFDFLSSVEEKHARHIDERATELIGHPMEAGRVSWEIPENFDEEEGSSRLLTRYRALAVAVRNEERAFAFYSYVAATVAEDRVRLIAEDLAKDELGHAYLLRCERRKAYHELAPEYRGRPVADLPTSMEELWTLAFEIEARAARYHRALADALAAESDPLAALFADAAADEEEGAREAAGQLPASMPERAPGIAPTVDGGLRLLEANFETYADIAERSREEDVLREVHRLAARAARRLTLVHGSIGNRLLDREAG